MEFPRPPPKSEVNSKKCSFSRKSMTWKIVNFNTIYKLLPTSCYLLPDSVQG